MCRALAYLGEPLLLNDLLYKPDRALVKQTYDASMMTIFNLAGFGMSVWGEGLYKKDSPIIYKSTILPFFDTNLKYLSKHIITPCCIGHIRGIPLEHDKRVATKNVHPFFYDDYKIAMAHNGQLAYFSRMRFSLLDYIDPKVAELIEGNTDSEWIYALFLSCLKKRGEDFTDIIIAEAIYDCFSIIKTVREKHDIHISSAANLFISNGKKLIATRYTFNFGHYENEVIDAAIIYTTLWYTLGNRYGYYDDEYKMIGNKDNHSILIASEPLTRDISTWIEVPEHSILFAEREDDIIKTKTLAMDI